MPGVDGGRATDDGRPGRVYGRHRPARRMPRWRWIAAGAAAVVVAGSTTTGILLTAGASPDRETGGSRPAPSQAAPTPAGPTVSLAAVGDIIMGSTPKLPPNDGRTFFDDVKPQLKGDVVMGNFEGALTGSTTSTKCRPPASPSPVPSPSTTGVPGPTPTVTPSRTPVERCFAFRMPPSYARWIRDAGFTVVNLANNHTRDYGAQGLRDTRAALSAHGVQHTGAPGEITVLRSGSVRVAVLGFAPYHWTQSVVDIEAASALVEQAAAGADIVVVNMHAGGEGADKTHVRPGTEMFLGENRGDPTRFARAVVDAGADLVVGHSPHVMRAMEWYNGRLIAYSMGNFAGYRVLTSTGVQGIGGILKVTLRPDGSWVRGSLVPTRMVNRGLPALDPQRQAVTLVRDLSTQDLGPAACPITPAGELQPPST